MARTAGGSVAVAAGFGDQGGSVAVRRAVSGQGWGRIMAVGGGGQ